MKQGPEILLIDFDDNVAEILRGRRYFVGRGTSSVKVRTKDPNAPFKVISEQSLPPVYEQEIVFYDSPKVAEAGTLAEPEVKRLEDAYPFQYSAVEKWVGDGGIAIVFVNSHTSKEELAWLPVRMNLESIPSDSKFAAVEGDRVFGAFGKDLLDTMEISVKITDASGAQPIVRNLSGDPVACYFTRGKGLIAILPDVADKAAAILRLLERELRDFNAPIFQGHTRTSWLDADTYTFPPYWKQREELEQMKKDFEQKLKAKEAEVEAALEERTPFLGLVAASESGNGVPPFAQVVAKTMEFLGYDLKEKAVDAARRPRTARGTLLAGKSTDGKAHLVASVIATTGEPEVNDYINLLGAVTDHIRETGDAQARGVLIYNSQFEVPTAERREPFAGNEDILENLKTQNAGVLTGWTLFKLVQDIKGGLLSKEDARRELESSGLIAHTSRSLKGEGEPRMGTAPGPTVIIPRGKPEPPMPEPIRKVEPIRLEATPAPAAKPAEPPAPAPAPPEPPKVEVKPPEPPAEKPSLAPSPAEPPKLEIKPPEPISIQIPSPAEPAPPAAEVPPEPPKIEVKPPEAPTVEPPKVEVKPPEPPRVEPPKVEIKPPEAPVAKPPEPPKVEIKPAETPKAEPPRVEVKPPEPPKPEAPTVAAPRVEPKTPEPGAAIPKGEPLVEAEKKEPPKETPPKKEGKMDYNKVVRKLLKWE